MKSICPHSRFFPILIAIVGLCGATAARAAIVDTYDGVYTATSTQLADPPGPTIMTGGPNGNFLRLITSVQSNSNHYTYDQPVTEVGAFDTIRATFDFRITPGTAGLADGFHLLFLPTATFGTTGDGPNPTAEEPNVPNAFAIGVDVYPGINNISAHWDNAQRIEHTVPVFDPGLSFRDNGVFNRAQIDLQRVGNGTNATVTLTEDSLATVPGTVYKAFEVVIPNMLPYDNRIQLGGRTGGETMNVDIDNLNVASTNPFTPLAAAPGGHLFQDFDRAGTTGYRAVQNAQRTDVLFRPGPLLTPAEAGSDGVFLRLVPDAVAGANSHASFDRGADGGASNTITERVRFDVRFGDTAGNPADGLGVLFLPTSTQGTAGDGIGSSEEPNHTGVLAIGIDVYSNGVDDPAPAISVHWNGAEVADQAITDSAFALNQFHRMEVIRQPVAGGINLTVLGIANINGGGTVQVPLISDVFVPGATNYDYRVQFSARTGGADAAHDIDNIVASQQSPAPLSNTRANFNHAEGSAWKGYRFGGNAAPDVKNEAGTNGDFLRLANDSQNDQHNSITFDQQLDGLAAGISGVVANFDFRMTSVDAPADGMSLMLIPTATFGTTGPGVLGAVGGFAAEEPNVPGAFGLGFDIYNGAEVWNEASLHWNGAPAAESNIDPASIDLDSGVFHHAQLVLTKSGSDVLADLILTPDVFGTLGAPGAPVTVFNDVLLPGMAFYDYRVEFAARTGGLNASFDLDNILVQVPEPSTAVLLMAGLSGLFTCRRRTDANRAPRAAHASNTRTELASR